MDHLNADKQLLLVNGDTKPTTTRKAHRASWHLVTVFPRPWSPASHRVGQSIQMINDVTMAGAGLHPEEISTMRGEMCGKEVIREEMAL